MMLSYATTSLLGLLSAFEIASIVSPRGKIASHVTKSEEGRRSTWAERAAPKTRAKGHWRRPRARPKRPPELSPATRKRRPRDARSKRKAPLRISWARPRTYSSSLVRRQEELSGGPGSWLSTLQL